MAGFRRPGWRAARRITLLAVTLLFPMGCGHRGTAADLDSPVGMSTVASAPATRGGDRESTERTPEPLACPVRLPSFVFETGSAVIDPSQALALEGIARCLTVGPSAGSSVIAIGHADAVGGSAENLVLALERAAKIRAVLVAQGVDATRIVATAAGERTTAAAEHGRRVDLLLTSSLPAPPRVE